MHATGNKQFLDVKYYTPGTITTLQWTISMTKLTTEVHIDLEPYHRCMLNDRQALRSHTNRSNPCFHFAPEFY